MDVSALTGTQRIFDISGGTVELRGFTLANGNCGGGCGVQARDGANVEIRDMDLHGHQGYVDGGSAILVASSSLDVYDTVIHDNTCEFNVADPVGHAAGLRVRVSTVNLYNVAFYNNVTTNVDDIRSAAIEVGGTSGVLTAENLIVAGNTARLTAAAPTTGIYSVGVYVGVGARATITNATIYGNVAVPAGGPVFGVGFRAERVDTVFALVNVTSSGNQVSGPAGTVSAGGYSIANTTSYTFDNCNAFDNHTANYDVTSPTGTSGNIEVDPRFTDVSSADPEMWDLTLMTGSLLIDAGLSSILDPDGSTSDIGAYGGPGAANW